MLPDDPDGDGVLTPRDSCPVDPNPTQGDWNRDGVGDACDPSARVALDRVVARRGRVLLRGRIQPAALVAARDWRVRVQRRACGRSTCRWRTVTQVAGQRKRSRGRVEASVRLRRAGRYRFQARLVHRRLEAVRSRFRTLTLR